jgi:hypothetical protein
MSGVQHELQAFATRLLERRGGLVDWPEGAREGTAVLPAPVAATLGEEGEFLPLSGEPGGKGLSVHLASDFLETAGRLLESEPRTGAFQVPELYLKRGSMDEAVRRAFTWLNAKVVVREARPVRIEYHTWWFHAAMLSEDRWETRLAVTVNAQSGTEVELPDPLALWEIEPSEAPAPRTAPTYARAVAAARARVERLSADFLGRMDARLARDRKRLRDYYGALSRETARKTTAGKGDPDPEKLDAKKRAVDLELRRKLSELEERYAVDAALEPLVLIRTEIPALAVDLLVHRKSAREERTVYWNPLLKQIEPICCSGCGRGTFSVAFTNQDVQPLCPKCAD